MLDAIPTEVVWITIDKDVLPEPEALANWGQGHISLQALQAMLRAADARKWDLGADICGEYSPPWHGNWLKRIGGSPGPTGAYGDGPAKNRRQYADRLRTDSNPVRRLRHPTMTSTLATLLLLPGSVARDVSGQVCFKLGVGDEVEGAQAPSLVYTVLHSPWIARGAAVYALGFVLWFAALSRSQLSVAFPFTALGYVGVVVASRFVLNERIMLRRRVGITGRSWQVSYL